MLLGKENEPGEGGPQGGEKFNNMLPITLIELSRWLVIFPFPSDHIDTDSEKSISSKSGEKIIFSNEEKLKMLSVIDFLTGEIFFLICRTWYLMGVDACILLLKTFQLSNWKATLLCPRLSFSTTHHFPLHLHLLYFQRVRSSLYRTS